jgi:hypothetical protein
MPLLSVFFIRTSLVYFALGVTYGGWMLFNKGVPIFPNFWGLLEGHIEFLMIGWIIQLILGVAFWILPRFSRFPARGNEALAWISYLLINIGLWMELLSPLFKEFPWLPTLGRVIETGAAVMFVLHAWPRIKPARP